MPRPSRVYAGDEAKMQLQAGMDPSNIDFNWVETIDDIPPKGGKESWILQNVSKPVPVLPVLAMSPLQKGRFK
jgi:hypothetical protein